MNKQKILVISLIFLFLVLIGISDSVSTNFVTLPQPDDFSGRYYNLDDYKAYVLVDPPSNTFYYLNYTKELYFDGTFEKKEDYGYHYTLTSEFINEDINCEHISFWNDTSFKVTVDGQVQSFKKFDQNTYEEPELKILLTAPSLSLDFSGEFVGIMSENPNCHIIADPESETFYYLDYENDDYWKGTFSLKDTGMPFKSYILTSDRFGTQEILLRLPDPFNFYSFQLSADDALDFKSYLKVTDDVKLPSNINVFK